MDVWTRKQKSRGHREAGRRQLRKHCEGAKSLKETGELSRETNTGWWERWNARIRRSDCILSTMGLLRVSVRGGHGDRERVWIYR